MLKKASVLKGPNLFLAKDLIAEEKEGLALTGSAAERSKERWKESFYSFFGWQTGHRGKVITPPALAEIIGSLPTPRI